MDDLWGLSVHPLGWCMMNYHGVAVSIPGIPPPPPPPPPHLRITTHDNILHDKLVLYAWEISILCHTRLWSSKWYFSYGVYPKLYAHFVVFRNDLVQVYIQRHQGNSTASRAIIGLSQHKPWRSRVNGLHGFIIAPLGKKIAANSPTTYIFLSENAVISMIISLKFIPNGPICNIPALGQIMAWRRPGDKPLSEPMSTRFTDAYIYINICIYIYMAQGGWVNCIATE